MNDKKDGFGADDGRSTGRFTNDGKGSIVVVLAAIRSLMVF